ncbi:PP2C family protein-serine/threonine phosphatase [Streptomyces sp. NPDC001373]|uniref:PP2C family protein-serine/threonine phosphatase n=1 Tax=Streptomyces sp. NPDC001373 TaxID=3364565 RepID=UPI0036960244
MLHSPDLARHPDIAVRYLPAAGSLNVCGDWYDVVDLLGDGFAVAVGDVVGHGLEAAAVMGMLRSALSAAVRALHEPARSLEVLGLYSRSVEGALATTALQAVIDAGARRITYSSAGHPPADPVASRRHLRPAGPGHRPAAGRAPQHASRPQASLSYTPGDTLILYTDGLIERRGENIDAGLHRLTDALTRYGRYGTERLADALLARLGVVSGARDDIALIIVRL